MSYYPDPTDWKDLQTKTAKLLNECGFLTKIEKTIKTVRELINIDVYVENTTVIPKSIYFIECKYWNKRVTQEIINAFRTVVSDYGPNHGYIITKTGFQKGAYNASSYTNIELLTWNNFIQLFKESWKERMFNRIWNRFNNISYYRGEYVGDILKTKHISQKLNNDSKEKYKRLLEESNDFLNNPHQFPNFLLMIKNEEKQFPLKMKIRNVNQTFNNESQLYDRIILEQNTLLDKFDDIFKKKIRKVKERWG